MQLHSNGVCKPHHHVWRKGNQLKFKVCKSEAKKKGKNVGEGGRRHNLLHPLLHLHQAIVHLPSMSKDEEFNFFPKQTNGRWKWKKAYANKGHSLCYCKFKEGAKSITFLIYDGTFEAMDKVLGFIQQYDAAFLT